MLLLKQQTSLPCYFSRLQLVVGSIKVVILDLLDLFRMLWKLSLLCGLTSRPTRRIRGLAQVLAVVSTHENIQSKPKEILKFGTLLYSISCNSR